MSALSDLAFIRFVLSVTSAKLAKPYSRVPFLNPQQNFLLMTLHRSKLMLVYVFDWCTYCDQLSWQASDATCTRSRTSIKILKKPIEAGELVVFCSTLVLKLGPALTNQCLVRFVIPKKTEEERSTAPPPWKQPVISTPLIFPLMALAILGFLDKLVYSHGSECRWSA
jgi:hypothetical protein